MKLRTLNLTILEYLILYDLAHDHEIKTLIDFELSHLVSLEKKGYIRLERTGIILRDKFSKLFAIGNSDELFEEWLELYPVKVKNKFGGTRALSPSSSDTILGNRLKRKWDTIFRKDIDKMRRAILVLRLDIASKKRNGDLEYMVEATRWLNEGYHEKYDYLIEENNEERNEDWL